MDDIFDTSELVQLLKPEYIEFMVKNCNTLSFAGTNLFALDNEFHTAKEVALINQREDILRFLDTAIAKESALNTKVH